MYPVGFNVIHIKTYHEHICETTTLKKMTFSQLQNFGPGLLTACCHSDLALQESLQFVSKLSVGILLGFSMRARKKKPLADIPWNPGCLMTGAYVMGSFSSQVSRESFVPIESPTLKDTFNTVLKVVLLSTRTAKATNFLQRLAEKSFNLYHILTNLVVELSLNRQNV